MESSHEDDVRRTLNEAARQRWQLAIIILNSRNSEDVYNLVKSYANGQLGLMTQCVNYQALKRNIRKLNMCMYILERGERDDYCKEIFQMWKILARRLMENWVESMEW